MDVISSGKSVLQDAETALQQLMVKAAVDGDYPSIDTLSAWARTLAELRQGSGEKSLGHLEGMKLSSISPQNSSSKKKRRSKAKYPKFIRDGNHLVKIGWSKKERSEYEHKADREAVRALVSAIASTGQDGTRFSMDSLLPVETITGESIPDYQSYLILAWLRSADLLEQHGRLGYTIGEGVDLIDVVEDCWAQLPSRSQNKASRKA